MQKIIALTWSDLKNILREQILYGMFLIAPVLQYAVLKWGVPALAARFPVIEDYYPGIILFLGLQVVAGIGFVVASILLDERDEDVLTAIRISPVSANTFLAYRLLAVTLIAFLWSLLILSATGLVRFPPLAILGTSFLLALNAPIVVLFLAGFSSNKVEGLAAYKGINLVLIAPAAVMFMQGGWQYLFVPIPTYWLYQSLDLSAVNQAWGASFFIAIMVYSVVLVGLVVWFRKRVFR